MSRERGATLSSYRDADGRLQYKARIWLKDGSRLRVPVSTKNRFDADKAKVEADLIQAEENTTHAFYLARLEELRANGETNEGETASEWHARFTKTRTHDEARADAQRWAKWIDPIIGERPMESLTRDDVERVRDHLDAAIVAGTIAGKTAATLWSILTTACKHATLSKDKALRVLAENPCKDVIPPERTDSKQKPFIYPAEAAKLFACAEVPASTRALYAVAAYLFLRPNELAELRRSDIDFDARVVRVARAFKWTSKEVGPPKTRNGVRVVPIHPNLAPLLEALCASPAPRDALLFPDFRNWGKSKASARLRDHLRIAGVDRPRLFEDSATGLTIPRQSRGVS